jgi:UTP-glucose-1-phosphate uridylyltransferase
MAAPLNTCTTIEQRGVVRCLWAKNLDAAKDIHKEMLPIATKDIHKEMLPIAATDIHKEMLPI